MNFDFDGNQGTDFFKFTISIPSVRRISVSKILRLNLTNQTFAWQNTPPAYMTLGGRALTSRIIRDEVPPTCHPLGAANKLVVAPGLLTGTNAANSGRISVGGKSPLTGGIKESNSGGIFSQKLARLEIKAVVLEGQPAAGELLLSLKFPPKMWSFSRPPNTKGLGTYDTTARLWERFGEKTGVMVIGPAGEKRLTGASIQFADPAGRPARAAGRGGLGAVMGSKGVKAIVVDDRGTEPKLPLADPRKVQGSLPRNGPKCSPATLSAARPCRLMAPPS